MKQYQQSLGLYLVSRREGDHARAAELARSLCRYWRERGNETELRKWEKVLEEHLDDGRVAVPDQLQFK